MKEKEYKKVIEIIDKYMTILHENVYAPRLVLTMYGFDKVKKELREMVEENGSK